MNNSVSPYVLDVNGSDVYAEAAALRERGDVTRVEFCGIGGWAITSHTLLERVLEDPRISRDPRLHWPAWINGEIPQEWPLFTWFDARNMFTTYGSEHQRLRRDVAKTLTVRLVDELRPRIAEIISEVLDALPTGPGVVDLASGYAAEIPIRVFCELIGITDVQVRDGMCRCVKSLFNTSATAEEVTATHSEIHFIINALIAEKKKDPGEDLASALIAAQAEEGDSSLTEEELVGTMIVLMMGGYETTANLLGNAIYALLMHPTQLEYVRSSTISWDDVIEETLRALPSVASLPLRFAVEDLELGGVTIRKGDAIIAALAAAGRDSQFYGPDANKFDATRANKKHLAFGHGSHLCLGAKLARVEAALALPPLFEKYPRIKLATPADQLKPISSFIINGFQALPVILNDDFRVGSQD